MQSAKEQFGSWGYFLAAPQTFLGTTEKKSFILSMFLLLKLQDEEKSQVHAFILKR